MLTRQRVSFAIACAIALGTSTPIAAAQDSDEPATDDDLIARPESGSYFSLAFAGGMLLPQGDVAERYEPGITAQLSLGFTSSVGLGVQATLAYSPLRGQPMPSTSSESHMGQALLTPRFVLGDGTVRLWIAGGGGAVAMREHIESDGAAPAFSETKTEIEPAAAGAAGLELHVFESGGIGVFGRYAHSFGKLAARLYSVTGGLVLTFR